MILNPQQTSLQPLNATKRDEKFQLLSNSLGLVEKIIYNDFHPFTKISDILTLGQPTMSYFSTDAFAGEMAHARSYDKTVIDQMPKCLYRKYTVSEIINAVLSCGFTLEKFDEHPAWTDERLPGEFTLVAGK